MEMDRMEGTAAVVGDDTNEELILKQPEKIAAWMVRGSGSIPCKINFYLEFCRASKDHRHQFI
jgi:hypothetical protein